MKASTLLPAAWLKPLVLRGGRHLPNHIVPGAMEGINGPVFCRVYGRLGLVRCWITPFIRISDAAPRPSRLVARLAPFLDTGLPVVAQIMGTETAPLVETARRLTALGCVGIDLNCACPSKMVIGSGSGGACLRDLAWIRRTLGSLREACPEHGLSVKLRAGFADPAEMPGIMAAVALAEPDFVILHYRTVREEYNPVPSGWQRFARARELLPATCLIASGDLFSPAAAAAIYAITAVDGVAPARGLMRDPWLIQHIEQMSAGQTPRPTSANDQRTLLADYIRTALDETASQRTGFVIELAKNMLGKDDPLFLQLIRQPTLAGMLEILADLNRDSSSGHASRRSPA